jgi:hypothetical protein
VPPCVELILSTPPVCWLMPCAGNAPISDLISRCASGSLRDPVTSRHVNDFA